MTHLRTTTVLAAALLCSSCAEHTGTATLLNKAEEPISLATLTMSWGEKIDVTNLNPSDSATVTYRVREGDVRVEVVFRSGKRLETDRAYIATGVDYRDQITITASEIQVVHVPVPSR